MNITYYLNHKGYSARTMQINGHFNLIVNKGDKLILKISSPPMRISQDEFQKQLFNLVKEQIDLYENEVNFKEELKNETDKDIDNRCETLCVTSQEPSKECGFDSDVSKRQHDNN